jgi:uncharacterized membrane protein YdjX (TVP38/TMEM64 family)
MKDWLKQTHDLSTNFFFPVIYRGIGQTIKFYAYLAMDQWMNVIIAVVSFALIGFAYYYRKRLRAWKKYGLVGLFLVNVISNVGFSPIAPVANIAAGAIYNPVVVGTVAASGAVTGDSPLYFIGKGLTKLKTDESKWYGTILNYFNQNAFVTIFLFSLIPNPFFDLVAFMSGATGYPFLLFAFAAFAGKWLKCTFYGLLGKKFIHLNRK